jgi:hypothetical protein
MLWRFIQITGSYGGFVLAAFCAGGVYKQLSSARPDHETVRILIVAGIIFFCGALATLVMYLGDKIDQLRETIEKQNLRR